MTTTRPMSRRAFSLIELLIVILIIALVVAIVLPALSHARKAARKAATTELMGQVQTACSSFILSERRMPGYFTARDMGTTTNGDNEGFTGMENVMFDLAGGVVAQGPGAWQCGPVAATAAWYNPDMVGVAQGNNKAYFTPPSKYFKFQNGVEGIGDKEASANNKAYIRDLVDAEGTPILMWSSDNMAVQPVKLENDFAATSSDALTPQKAARFYWNSNAAFLRTAACGAKRIDQATNSLIGWSGNTAHNGAATTSLLGVLGNPSSPVNLTPPSGRILPSAPRGQFVMQAAGSDATFVANINAPNAGDRGGKLVNNFVIDYGMNFRGQSKDLMSDFDDIIMAGG